MTMLRLLSWPYVRRHPLRTAVTISGIVLGVAVFLAMHAANRAVVEGFSATIDRIAGKTHLQVTAGESGFGEDVLETVQGAASVRVAVPVIEVVAESTFKDEGPLLILGVDMTGDRSLRDYDLEDTGDSLLDDPLIFLAQPDSLIVSTEFAARHALRLGSVLTLGTNGGDRALTVRGIIRAPALASAYGGNVAVMDIYAAQLMFGRGRTFDRIDIGLPDGVTVDAATRDIQARVGPGFDVQPPSARGRQFQSLLASYSLMVSISSAFALFIGMFIIYNSLSVSVAERQTEIGTLRALGASHEQIRRLFLLESLTIGAVGSLLGVGAGSLMADRLAAGISTLVSDVYRLGQPLQPVHISPWLLLGSFGLGVVTAAVAGVLPAGAAARLDPVQALQKARTYTLSPAHVRRRVVISAGLLAMAAIPALGVTDHRPLYYAGFAATMLAALLLTPLLTLAMTTGLRPLLLWARPVEGAVAADSLTRAPRRASASVAALMCALALAIAFEGMGLANYRSVTNWMDTVLNPDLFVMPSQTLDMRTARFPADMGQDLAAVPGVTHVQPVRNARTTYRGTPVMVIGLDMNSIAETVHTAPVSGTAPDMYHAAATGGGVILSDSLAQLQHLTLGDTVELPAPYGTLRLPVLGIIVDYSDQQGAIMIDRQVFARFWRDDSVNLFRVYTASGIDPMVVRAGIVERFAGRRQVVVLTNAALKQHISRVLDQWTTLTTMQVAVAVAVAILGIINTLTVSISDRRRELGVLRAVGGLRWQVRRSVWMEAATLGTLGVVLGAALGAVSLYFLLDIAGRDLTGIRLAYEFPFKIAALLLPVICLASLGASLWPAELAVRMSLVEALEYE